MRLKTTLSILLFFFAFMLHAQDSTRHKRFYVGLTGSPDYSYRFRQTSSSILNYTVNWENAYERPNILFTVGVDCLIKFNRKTAFGFGLLYSVKGEKTSDTPISSVPPTAQSAHYTYIFGGRFTDQFYVNYLDIPIKFDYYFSSSKLSPYLVLGISTNIFLFERITSTTTGTDGTKYLQVFNEPSTFHTFNPQGQMGFGFNYCFNTSLIRVEPIFRVSLLNASTTMISTWFYSFGLNCSYFFGVTK
jgi:hypothetical protein